MIQYLNLLQEIKKNGKWEAPARPGMPRTLAIHGAMIKMDLADGFPLLTTKEVFWKGVLHELLWFLKGETNVEPLIKAGVNIWNGDGYKYFLKMFPKSLTDGISKEDWIRTIKENDGTSYTYYHPWGKLGKIYSYQWRRFEGHHDQITEVIKGIDANPWSRYHVVSAWNPTEINQGALPPCHMIFQFMYRKEENIPFLDLIMMQRSCDTFLGVPFNLASYAALLQIICAFTGTTPGIFTWVGNNVHVYENHMSQIEEQLSRTPGKLPSLSINSKKWGDLNHIQFEDFTLIGYEPQSKIKGDLSVGF